MRKKIFALIACLLFILSTIGIAYAKWDDTVTVSSTLGFGILDPEYVGDPTWMEYHEDPRTGTIEEGEYKGKNVGETTCAYDQIDGVNKILRITISNAYPGYIVKCNSTIENTGTIIAYLTGVEVYDHTGTLTWDPSQEALCLVDKPIIFISFRPSPLIGTALDVTGEASILELETRIEIGQDAQQGLGAGPDYYFDVKITFSDVMP